MLATKAAQTASGLVEDVVVDATPPARRTLRVRLRRLHGRFPTRHRRLPTLDARLTRRGCELDAQELDDPLHSIVGPWPRPLARSERSASVLDLTKGTGVETEEGSHAGEFGHLIEGT